MCHPWRHVRARVYVHICAYIHVIGSVSGRSLGEAVVLEGPEATGEGQVRRAPLLAVLPPEQFRAHADAAQGAEPQGQGHQRQVR